MQRTADDPCEVLAGVAMLLARASCAGEDGGSTEAVWRWPDRRSDQIGGQYLTIDVRNLDGTSDQVDQIRRMIRSDRSEQFANILHSEA